LQQLGDAAVSKKISSSEWTGPPGDGRRYGRFTHRVGDHSITTDYQRILDAQRAAEIIPAEVRDVRRLALLLLISPISLWLASLMVDFATRDALVRSPGNILFLWSLVVMAVAAWQLQSRSTALIDLRKVFLAFASAATVAASIGFAYYGIDSYSRVIALAPERTFELYKVRGRRPFKSVIYWHQRSDGSTVEGIEEGHPLPYSQICTLVQRLDGPFGFSWLRVLGRSRRPERGQLNWAIRREECFSSIPLTSLPR
jgi:hypothetical protein